MHLITKTMLKSVPNRNFLLTCSADVVRTIPLPCTHFIYTGGLLRFKSTYYDRKV